MWKSKEIIIKSQDKWGIAKATINGLNFSLLISCNEVIYVHLHVHVHVIVYNTTIHGWKL